MSSSWSQDVYVQAWDFATLAHRGQSYAGAAKGQVYDYINHVGSVAMEVIWALNISEGFDGNLAVQCALLHDVLEDTSCRYQQLSEQFGIAVADGVNALSKDPAAGDKQAQMLDSLARIQQQPKEVWLVKLADRITNLSEPPYYWQRSKKITYRDEAWLIYQQLKPANQALAQRLLSRIEAYQHFIDQA